MGQGNGRKREKRRKKIDGARGCRRGRRGEEEEGRSGRREKGDGRKATGDTRLRIRYVRRVKEERIEDKRDVVRCEADSANR
jgi:hypothetical protein